MSEQDKLQGADIIRRTGCRVGTHVFTYTSLNEWTRCACGMFTFDQWRVEAGESPSGD